jgi:hypothetical protein
MSPDLRSVHGNCVVFTFVSTTYFFCVRGQMRHLVFVGSTCKFVSTILILANRVSLKYRSVNLLGGESTEKESKNDGRLERVVL